MDVGNPFLAVVPSRVDTGTVQTAQGMRGVVTTRTSSATVTEFLTKADLLTRARVFNELADKVSDTGIIVVGGSLNGG
jgi:hypothetical protein